MAWLLRMEAWDPALPGVRTLYFSDVGLVTTPSESPASVYWDRRIDMPPSLGRSAFEGTAAGGPSETAFGQLTLANEDGGLDALAAYTAHGHTVEVRRTGVQRPVLADFAVVLVGVVERLVVADVVTVAIADRREVAELPYQPARFLGTGGAEGSADWVGVKKPRALGICWQVEPDVINEPANIYAYGDGTRVGGIMQARDQGIPLGRGADYADHAGLVAATIPDAELITCDALGLFRLAGPPANPVTADVLGRVIGTNICANNDFATGLTGWTAGTGWSAGAGTAAKAAGTASALTRAVTTEPGAWYALGITLTTPAAGLSLVAGSLTLVADLSSDNHRVAVFQSAGASTVIGVSADAAFAGAVDDFWCIQVAARAGEMMRIIIEEDTPLTSADIDLADIAALDVLQPAALGLYTRAGEEISVPDALSRICQSIGAWWGFDPADGKFRCGRMAAPSATPDHTLTARDVSSVTPQASDLRLHEQTVEAVRRWRPLQETEIAGAITDVLRRSLVAEFYAAVATHAATATEAKSSKDARLESLFAYQDAAQAEASRLAALRGPLRLACQVEMPDDPAITLMQTVRLIYPRFGYAAGRNMRVLRIDRDDTTLTLTLWG